MDSSNNVNNSSPSLWTALCHETRKGASTGAKYGLISGGVVVTAATAVGLEFYILETALRALGFSPKWPLDEKDCELEQFRHLSTCNGALGSVQKPISQITWVPAVLSTTTVVGATVGAVAAVARVVKKDVCKKLTML